MFGIDSVLRWGIEYSGGGGGGWGGVVVSEVGVGGVWCA